MVVGARAAVLHPVVSAGFGRTTCKKKLVILGPTTTFRITVFAPVSILRILPSSDRGLPGDGPRPLLMMPWNCSRHGQYVQFPIHKLIVIRFIPRSLPTRCVCIYVVSLFGWVILDVMLVVLSDCSFVRLSISFYRSPFFFARFLLFDPRSPQPCIMATRAHISVLPLF